MASKSRVGRLVEQGRLGPGVVPQWLPSNIHLEVIMGSRAYGCNDPDSADYDMRGFSSPRR